MEKAKLITTNDVAKILGVEKEYNEILLEQELEKNFEEFVKSDAVNLNQK